MQMLAILVMNEVWGQASGAIVKPEPAAANANAADIAACIKYTSSSKMWKNFLHVLLILQAFSIKTIWTKCVVELNPVTCVYDVQCIDSTYVPSPRYYADHHDCNKYVYSYQRHVPRTVVYRKTRFTEDETLNWTFDNSDEIHAIVSIDLSNNKYTNLPIFQSMRNLKFLNMSHNSFTVAVLSNAQILPQLSEIDFSYNMIVDIEITDNLNTYNKLEKLDLSHNLIYNIPDVVFQSFGQLKFLNLSYNHLKTLNILSFEGLKNLRYLYLEHNDIIDLNSSLLRFKNLRELSLKHNKIVKILSHDFHNLYDLRKIDLSSNKISNIEKPTFEHMSVLRELDLSDNALELVFNEYFNSTNNLHKVDLSANKLKHLPVELFKGQKISFFSIKDNILQGELVTGMFLGLGNVTVLNISNQYLTSVEVNAFTGLESLEILLLNDNKIKSICKNAFGTLSNVTHLDLSNNNIVVLDFEKKNLLNLRLLSIKNNLITYIKHDDLMHLDSLVSIDLSNNNITEIDNNSFKPLKFITDFQISNNSLPAALDSNTFDGITLISIIDISFSRISLVKNNSFQFMTQLTHLNMSHSLIKELQFDSFAHVRRMVTIDISYNRLTSFIVNTTDLPNLCTLLLHNNLISEISTATLKNIPNLLKISFSYNKLQTISTNAFADQSSLSELDLSFNHMLNVNFTRFINFGYLRTYLRTLKLSGIININFQQINSNHITKLELSYARIKNITSLWLYNLEHVETLALSNNEILSIDKDAFARIIYLQHLDLSYNNMKYIQPGAFKNNRNLLTLNISNNYLTRVNYGTFRGLNELNILDLSYNYIESLEGLHWQEIESLNTLIIDNNRINDFNYLELSETQLSRLSIGDNPINCRRMYEIKQIANFTITALREDEHSDNVDGIVCNKNLSLLEDNRSTGKTEESENVIKMLKSILLNSPVSNTSDKRSGNGENELLANVTYVVQKSNIDILKQLSLLSDAAYSFSNINNQTNSLLERLLKVVVIMNSAIRSPRQPLNENITRDNLTLYINKVKHELEEDMLVQQESILANPNNKISMAIHKKNLVQNEMALSDAKTSKSKAGFVEICVILILIIAVSFLIYKLWDWFKRSPRISQNTSLSRQQIAESFENSQL